MLLPVAVCALPCNSCGFASGARAQFATKYSCPEERVQVTARGDLDYADLVAAAATPAAPPAEVQVDPARLAKWNADRSREARDRRVSYWLNGIKVFEVEGCDHHRLMGCAHGSNGDGSMNGDVSCYEVDAPIPPRR